MGSWGQLMPITEAQRERRRKGIGASDMAAILGVDPYRTAGDVFIEKTQDLEPLQINEAMKTGNFLEAGVLSWAEQELGKIKRGQYRSLKGSPLFSNCDALLMESGDPVEAKTSGITHWARNEEWGEPGTDQIPDHINIQGQVQMLCTERETCHVAALIGGRGFQLFRVRRSEAVCTVIIDSASAFWDGVLSGRPAQPLSPAAVETLKRIKRRPGSYADVPATLITAYREANEAAREADKHKKAAMAELLTAMGDAEACCSEAGGFTYMPYSWKESVRKAGSARRLTWKKDLTEVPNGNQ